MALDLKQELEALVGALSEASVPFAVCGGIAVTIHGAPRLTVDLDLLDIAMLEGSGEDEQ